MPDRGDIRGRDPANPADLTDLTLADLTDLTLTLADLADADDRELCSALAQMARRNQVQLAIFRGATASWFPA